MKKAFVLLAVLFVGFAFSSPSAIASDNVLYVNPKDYGAAGNGTTDDTQAVQDAVDYIKSFGGGVNTPALLIHGRFKVTSSINMRDMRGLKIVGVTNWTDSNYIKGVNIAGPVLDLGGSMVSASDVGVISDNCYSAIWIYRTVDTSWAGPSSFINMFIYGTATKAMVYLIAGEEINFTNGNIENAYNAPTVLTSNKDELNIISSSYLRYDSRYGQIGISNNAISFRGTRMINGGQEDANPDGSIFRIYNGTGFYFSDMSVITHGEGPVFDIGPLSVQNVVIQGVRYENLLSPYGYTFIRLREGVNGLVIAGGNINNPEMIVMDNTATGPVTRSFIYGGVDTSYGVEPVYYKFKDVASTYIHAPFAHVVIDGYGSGNEITARSITYNASGGVSTNDVGSRNSVVPNTSSVMSKISETWQPQAADIDAAYHIPGRFTLPDGTNWNPKGLKNKPAMMLDRGDGEPHWFQFPVVGGAYPVNTVPGSNSASGTVGQFTWNSTHLYVAIGDGSWKRIPWDGGW